MENLSDFNMIGGAIWNGVSISETVSWDFHTHITISQVDAEKKKKTVSDASRNAL